MYIKILGYIKISNRLIKSLKKLIKLNKLNKFKFAIIKIIPRKQIRKLHI